MNIIKLESDRLNDLEQLPKNNQLRSNSVDIGDEFEGVRWMVKGIIPEGSGVIAGSAGVGKTSALAPLALAIAGIKAPDCTVEPEIERNVIYVTEDSDQLKRILLGMRRKLEWDEQTWNKVKDRFKVVNSKRLTDHEVRLALEEALEFFSNDAGFAPLVVFDTGSANFELENENSNSQVSRFMAVLKEYYSKHELSTWVVTHLTKDSKGQSIDNLKKISARGGGSWEGDANWTAILSSTGEDNTGDRVLKMDKKRGELDHDEIIFEGTVEEAVGKDRFGNSLLVHYRYTVPKSSSKYIREIKEFNKHAKDIKNEIISVTNDLYYPSKTEIKDKVQHNKDMVYKVLMQMLSSGELVELDRPEEAKRKGSKTYISVAESEHF